MAEELVQGGLSWWNSPRNFFSSSPCSNDIGWPQSHDLITETKSVRSSDESAASDGSSCLVIPDHHAIESMMPPSANPDGSWNQDLLRDSGRSEEDNYCSFLLDSSMNYRPQMNSSEEDSSMKQGFGVESLSSSSAESYSLLQTLFDTDSQPQQTPITSYPSSANYHMNSNGFLPKSANRLWNASSNLSSARPTFPPSPPSHFFASSLTNHKPNIAKQQHEQGKDLATVLVKKASNEPTFKRPRIETPSPLPTFKVRKEKLGDRITALQQLVSPFGKTDTASVLHEAIEYIKFLHDQVNALSTPYLKYGSPPVQRQQGGDKSRDEGGVVKDLKTRGLCLVPISSTFPVAAETSSDFWTPTLGGSFR